MLICFFCVCACVCDHVYLIDLSLFFSSIQPLVEPSCQKQIAITHLLDHCQLIRAFTTNVYGLLVCKKEILNLYFKTNFMWQACKKIVGKIMSWFKMDDTGKMRNEWYNISVNMWVMPAVFYKVYFTCCLVLFFSVVCRIFFHQFNLLHLLSFALRSWIWLKKYNAIAYSSLCPKTRLVGVCALPWRSLW